MTAVQHVFNMTVNLHPHLLVCFLCFIYNDLHDFTFNIFCDFLLWIAPTQHSHGCRQGASCRHCSCLNQLTSFLGVHTVGYCLFATLSPDQTTCKASQTYVMACNLGLPNVTVKIAYAWFFPPFWEEVTTMIVHDSTPCCKHIL